MGAFEQLSEMFGRECGSFADLAEETFEYLLWLRRNADRPDVRKLLNLIKKYSFDNLRLSKDRRSLLLPRFDGTVGLIWRVPANTN
jgi:hypothetical protein